MGGGNRLRTAGAVLLVLGGILLGVCWIYATNTYPIDHPGRPNLLDVVPDLIHLAAMEPFGAVLTVIGLVLMLLLGGIFYYKGRE
ncbi:MAG: hypothetical protein J6J81_01580 [Oscillospiraceae bacterium]|nr:hypothetical protein [Oscillospiraceae bacterium]